MPAHEEGDGDGDGDGGHGKCLPSDVGADAGCGKDGRACGNWYGWWRCAWAADALYLGARNCAEDEEEEEEEGGDVGVEGDEEEGHPGIPGGEEQGTEGVL